MVLNRYLLDRLCSCLFLCGSDHGKTEAAPEKKKGFFKRMIASAQEKAGAKPVK
jgi:hypothetical protein